jgi:hypothetical protein
MKVEARLVNLIRGFSGRLPDEYIHEYVSLAQHNECAVAFENLCIQLYEYNISPVAEEMATVQELAAQMNLEVNSWDFLKYSDS